MTLQVTHADFHVLNMRTRFPFRYGIASLTALPHLFLRVELLIDGRPHRGIAADGLPPKWFTKDPETHFRDDLADMLHVIESAAGFAEQIGPAPSVFDLWQGLYLEQMRWAAREGYPPLLWAFGVSLVERAVIDGFCRAGGQTFSQAVRANTLGVHLGEMHAELVDAAPADLLPAEPRPSIIARHTIGLADPLTEADIPPHEKLDDDLPHCLEACIRAYGLSHFKIKIGGDAEADLQRLTAIADILDRHCPRYAFTLDGNERFTDVDGFRAAWEKLNAAPALRPFMQHLLFVEQPLHRDIALSGETADALLGWPDRPPLIIDESDAHLGAAADALESGYRGVSHKNCKGVFKGIANACLIAHRRGADPDRPPILSAEDLANVGPVALPHDLAVIAALGIDHAERNGHHYFRGLSMYPPDVQRQVLDCHGDLYRRLDAGPGALGFPTLRIENGRLDLASVNAAPFGLGFDFDPTVYTPLDAWRFDSLET